MSSRCILPGFRGQLGPVRSDMRSEGTREAAGQGRQELESPPPAFGARAKPSRVLMCLPGEIHVCEPTGPAPAPELRPRPPRLS